MSSSENRRFTVTLPGVLSIAMVLLGGAGTVIWLSATMSRGETSYFWGIWLLVAAGALYLWRYRMLNGASALKDLLRRAGRTMAVPIMGVTLAIIIGGLIMLLTGYDPIESYGAMFFGGLVRNWHISVLNAAPLIFTALSVAFAFKAGLFNIGAEGQYYMGAMAATWLSLRLAMPALVTIPLVFIFAGLLGAIWMIIPAVLKVRTGA
ncbi:MAG: ABC transporter permease, partial [Alkalispirochaeta sp.]